MVFWGIVAGGDRGDHGLPNFFRNRRIYGNFTASLENFRTIAVGEDRGFEYCRKIIELGPLLYRCHDAPDAVIAYKLYKLSKFDTLYR